MFDCQWLQKQQGKQGQCHKQSKSSGSSCRGNNMSVGVSHTSNSNNMWAPTRAVKFQGLSYLQLQHMSAAAAAVP